LAGPTVLAVVKTSHPPAVDPAVPRYVGMMNPFVEARVEVARPTPRARDARRLRV
jgi:hypothetical protein